MVPEISPDTLLIYAFPTMLLFLNAKIAGTDTYTTGENLSSQQQFVEGAVCVQNDLIEAILTDPDEIARVKATATQVIDLAGAWLMPGVIDPHVHFREPGLTAKADIVSESHAAAAGGVTTVLDMPNVKPTTTTPEALAEKSALFAQKSVVNYGLFYGITGDNIDQALTLPDQDICGYKVFLGSSTGGMLMNDPEKLRKLFSSSRRVIAVHSESEEIIRENLAAMRLRYKESLPIHLHPQIRNTRACVEATASAIRLAQETGARLHICHVTTQEELELFFPQAAPLTTVTDRTITAEACVAHLYFTDADYNTLGSRIKCNPAIKSATDRAALRKALPSATSRIDIIATDHAPHLLSDKEGDVTQAASGMPTIQYSLLTMLELVRDEVLSLTDVVRLMCQAPALRFGINKRGFIRPGYKADLVCVSPDLQTIVEQKQIYSKCGWSPFEGKTFSHKILGTWINGKQVYDGEKIIPERWGEKISFDL